MLCVEENWGGEKRRKGGVSGVSGIGCAGV